MMAQITAMPLQMAWQRGARSEAMYAAIVAAMLGVMRRLCRPEGRLGLVWMVVDVRKVSTDVRVQSSLEVFAQEMNKYELQIDSGGIL